MSKLDELLKLRTIINQMQSQIDQIMPDAIEEALEIASTAKNKAIYSNENGRIVLCMKKKFPSKNDDILLSKLDEDITRISSELTRRNFSEISQIQIKIESLKKEIEELEKQQEKLSSSPTLISLKAQYTSRREESSYFDPTLSVYLDLNKK
ncbi:MAG: hypothetical protein ACKPJO_08380 [Dolichospermum sp.]